MDKKLTFDYEHYGSIEGLSSEDKALYEEARKACGGAYAPYSNFRVGAAARLESGRIVIGNNQESEVFPAGLCAERSLLFHHQSTTPEDRIVALAIASIPAQRECYPCGQCRQVLLDVEKRQGKPYRIIMSSDKSATVVSSAKLLLPFQFEL